MSFELSQLQRAQTQIEVAQKLIKEQIDRKAYTIGDIKTIRRLLLNAVRDNLDDLTGHMPKIRHY